MWVMTPRGFYSVVEHREDRDRVLIRCRAERDMQELAKVLPGLSWEFTPVADYPWPAPVDRRDWIRALVRLCGPDELDYANFKNAVTARNKDRGRVYGRVWFDLLQCEEEDETVMDAREPQDWEFEPLPFLGEGPFFEGDDR